ncbi:MAG: decarboxylating 6-phosphogluconate dehydrogenase [Alphaproteobacteria bacterium]|nr:decarboxylating 6-phosphogluconate dehydrogenase [Alphaproteobacteria bacterium]
MQLGIVGLGRMGGNIARRLMAHGHEVVVYDRNADTVDQLAKEHATPAHSLQELVQQLKAPRAVWVMLPAGDPTESTLVALSDIVEKGDVLIDGGNTFFKDDVRRAKTLRAKGIHYVDVGTSGGIWGPERGYCMMIGGEKEIVDRLDPIFDALAPGLGEIARTPKREGRDPRAERGYIHAGGNGAGHFVKMVHNGIEYGLMQAYAEGFDILRGRKHENLPEDERFDLNLVDIAEVWRRGSVISSWLLDLTAIALAQSPELDHFEGYVQDSGEGRWTVNAAVEEAVAATVITASLYARFASRVQHDFANRLLSAMRNQFGGHVESPVVKGTAEGPPVGPR